MIDFHKRLTELFGDRFIIKSEYKGMLKPISLYCSDCENIFTTLPKYVVRTKNPCSYCNNHQEPYTKEEFIEKCRKIHNNKYDYSLVEYTNIKAKIKIICPIHGLFEQSAENHMEKHGCPNCSNEARSKKQSKMPTIQGYKILEYKNARQVSKILCEKHNIIFYQRTDDLIKRGATCKLCSNNKNLGEDKIINYFKNNNILFERNKSFKELKDVNKLSYDFYLPDYNLLIEYNGIQHYKWIKYFQKTIHSFHKQKHHDWLKRKYAKSNNIKLLTIPYWDFDNLTEILENELK